MRRDREKKRKKEGRQVSERQGEGKEKERGMGTKGEDRMGRRQKERGGEASSGLEELGTYFQLQPIGRAAPESRFLPPAAPARSGLWYQPCG